MRSKHSTVIHTCMYCGTDFTARDGRPRKYCSRACYHTADRGVHRQGGPIKHGLHKSAEYRIWGGIKRRCLNPGCKTYIRYGGRGITICPEWLSFQCFYADMGPRPSPDHSLDRINNDGPYAPWNCRWATRSEQQRNRRDSVMITHNGETLTLYEWAERIGRPSHLIYSRLQGGMTIEDALSPADRTPRGREVTGAKLTDEAVIEIRQRYALGRITMAELGTLYGITEGNVYQIIRRKTWAHLE
jgi:hypothetical protein